MARVRVCCCASQDMVAVVDFRQPDIRLRLLDDVTRGRAPLLEMWMSGLRVETTVRKVRAKVEPAPSFAAPCSPRFSEFGAFERWICAGAEPSAGHTEQHLNHIRTNGVEPSVGCALEPSLLRATLNNI